MKNTNHGGNIEISQICGQKEDDFKSIVNKVKRNVETNFLLKNNNLSKSWGFVSGDVTMKNYSRFTIPAYSYQIYYNFTNSSGDVLFSKKENFNYEPIGYGQSITRSLYVDNGGGFQKISAEIKITSAYFIEELIAENIKGEGCSINDEL